MTNTAIHFEVKIRDLIILIIGILTILTFYPHLFTGIGKTRDDTQAALVALSNVDHFKVALDREKGFGRLRLGHYIENLSYLIDSPFYYKLFHIGPLVLNLLLFLYVLNMFYRSYALIGFFSIIYLASLQNSWEHNLLSCYPFLFTFSFNILLISVILFKKYLDTSMKSYLIISAGLFFLPLFTYEMFLLYFVIFIILAFIYGGSVSLPVENRLVRVIYILRPFLFYIAIFVIAYFVFRRLYQVNYDGVQIAKFTIRNFFGVVYQFSVSALPTYVFFHYQWLFDHYTDALEGHRYNLFYIVQNSRVEWMAKAALSAYFIYILAKAKQRVLDFRKFGATILISVALIFLPTLLFAITVKYQAWVQSGTQSYTATYFSFFGTTLFFTALFLYMGQLLADRPWLSRIYILTLCLSVALVSLLTDYSNYYVAKNMTMYQYKWKIFDEFLKTEEFEAIPSDSVIFAPSMFYNGTRGWEDTYWSDYVKVRKGKSLTILDKKLGATEFASQNIPESNLYYLKYLQEPRDYNQVLIFAKITALDFSEDYIYSDKVTVFSYSKNKKFIVYGSVNAEAGPEYLELDGEVIGKPEGKVFAQVVNKEDVRDPFIKTELVSPQINPDSIALSYYTSDIATDVYFSRVRALFKPDFYPPQSEFEANQWWCGPKGTLVLRNATKFDNRIGISLEAVAAADPDADLIIAGPGFVDKIPINSKGTNYTKTLDVPAETNVEITFTSDAKSVSNSDDLRNIVFGISSFKMIQN